MKFESTKQAYSALKVYLSAFIGGRKWDIAVCQCTIYNTSSRGTQWLILGNEKIEEGDFGEDTAAVWDGLDAAIYLRDEHLRTTGKRIWGLTFTLYPDGKYDIAYDYKKPDDYDDSEEDGGATNASPVADLLGGLIDSPKAPIAESFLQQAMSALQSQTAHNTEAWGLGTEAQWNLDMNTGSLHFTYADGRKLSAAVQVVGTYNTANGSFLWGWDHPSVPEPLSRAARLVYDYGKTHSIDAFTTRSTQCSDNDAWAYTAAAAQLDGAAGAYRGDASGTWVYMVFGKPKTV